MPLCQISSKSVKPGPKHGDFSIFQDGGRRHVGFSKFQVFVRSDSLRGLNCFAIPNLVEIDRSVAEI